MYALCITLRIGNIMKIKRKEIVEKERQNTSSEQQSEQHSEEQTKS